MLAKSARSSSLFLKIAAQFSRRMLDEALADEDAEVIIEEPLTGSETESVDPSSTNSGSVIVEKTGGGYEVLSPDDDMDVHERPLTSSGGGSDIKNSGDDKVGKKGAEDIDDDLDVDADDGEAPDMKLTREDVEEMVAVGVSLAGLDLSDLDLREAYLKGADLSGTDLSGAVLSGAYLQYADLSGADLSDAILISAHLEHADFSGADLSNADFSGANLTRANLSGRGTIFTILTGAEFPRAILLGATLTWMNLRDLNFRGAIMIETNLEVSDLRGAHLEGAVLHNARMDRSDIRGAHFENADLSGAILTHVSLEGLEFLEGRNWRNAIFIDHPRLAVQRNTVRGLRNIFRFNTSDEIDFDSMLQRLPNLPENARVFLRHLHLIAENAPEPTDQNAIGVHVHTNVRIDLSDPDEGDENE